MKWIEGPALFYYTLLPLVGQLVKNPPAMWETLVPIPELGRSRGEGNGYPLQYPTLDNSMDCIVHGVSKSWTQLSTFHFQLSWMGKEEGGIKQVIHF